MILIELSVIIKIRYFCDINQLENQIFVQIFQNAKCNKQISQYSSNSQFQYTTIITTVVIVSRTLQLFQGLSLNQKCPQYSLSALSNQSTAPFEQISMFGANEQKINLCQQAPWIKEFLPSQDDDEIFPINNKSQLYDLVNNVEFELKSQYQKGKLFQDKKQYLPGIVSIKTREVEATLLDNQQRSGVDLLCLIDKSGSMQGKKIKMVKQTLKLLLELLTENDRLQLITFESQAQRLTPLKRVNCQNRKYFQKIISSIKAEGGTKISQATMIAFQQLKQRKYRNNVISIFLLSDGQDKGTEFQVQAQLRSVDEVFTLHSFGFGQDHDAKLMTALCNLRNGSFYFVQDITLLDEFFADALGGLMSVVGEQLEVNIKCYPQEPYQNIQIHKTYGKMWTQTKQNREYKINLPQIASGTRKDFVFELGLPQFNVQIGDNQRQALIIEAELKMKNSSNGQIIVKKCSLTLTFFNLDEKINNNEEDIDVAAQYYRVKGADVIDDARRACEQNKHEDASKLIDNMITSIQRNEKVALKSAGIIQDLQQAKQGSTRKNYELFGQKQMCQMVSNTYQQQGVNAMFSAHGSQMQQQAPALYQNQVQYQMMQKVQQSKKQNPY